jgi:hypothetical protein
LAICDWDEVAPRTLSWSSDASAMEPTPTAQFLKKCRRVMLSSGSVIIIPG